jgi:hypothetical protein
MARYCGLQFFFKKFRSKFFVFFYFRIFCKKNCKSQYLAIQWSEKDDFATIRIVSSRRIEWHQNHGSKFDRKKVTSEKLYMTNSWIARHLLILESCATHHSTRLVETVRMVVISSFSDYWMARYEFWNFFLEFRSFENFFRLRNSFERQLY